MDKKLKCVNCGKEVITKNDFIGEMESKTNFTAVLGIECDINWLCDSCYLKAEELSYELIKIFKGNGDIPLSCIIKNKDICPNCYKPLDKSHVKVDDMGGYDFQLGIEYSCSCGYYKIEK